MRTRLGRALRRRLFAPPLNRYAANQYSENGEDGVLRELLRRLGLDGGWVVEFGAWDGVRGSNTYALISAPNTAFRAVYIEGDADRFADLQRTAARHPGRVIPIHAYVQPTGHGSLEDLLRATPVPPDFPLLSIDVDGPDDAIWEGLSAYRPAIVVIEVNSALPPPIVYRHGDGEQAGASFQAMLALGRAKGYTLVCHTGNMIFVRDDLVDRVGLPAVYRQQPEKLFLDAWVPLDGRAPATGTAPVHPDGDGTSAALLFPPTPPRPYFATIEAYCRGRTVLDLGVVQHDLAQTEREGWLHERLRRVAKVCVGVDYLEPEVAALRARGYAVIAGDVTKPLPIDDRFEVIVAGNLIEHLTNFDGFFANLDRLLAPGGRVLIVTPNVFYREQYLYAALKNDVVVNEEHTCWFDPRTLDQLARRFGFATQQVHWLDLPWRAAYLLRNGRAVRFNVTQQRWARRRSPSVAERLVGSALIGLARALAPAKVARWRRDLGSTDQLREFLLSEALARLSTPGLAPYRAALGVAPFTRSAVFLAVLTRQPSAPPSA